MASGGSGEGDSFAVSDGFRRTWDRGTYETMAKDRVRREKEERKKEKDSSSDDKHRELVKHREYKVDLDSKLGRSIVVTKTTPQAQSGGYYCNVCDCVVKDSINFLDHINGRKHQRNLGMSMRVERSTLNQVKERFEHNKTKKVEEKQKYDFEQRMKELREEEEKVKEYRREKRKERKRRERGEVEEDDDLQAAADPDLAAMMGFSGFGAKKKKS